MPGSKKPQSEKFIETARELGCDESEEAFERTFAKVVPPKRPKAKPPEKADKSEEEKPGQ